MYSVAGTTMRVILRLSSCCLSSGSKISVWPLFSFTSVRTSQLISPVAAAPDGAPAAAGATVLAAAGAAPAAVGAAAAPAGAAVGAAAGGAGAWVGAGGAAPPQA